MKVLFLDVDGCLNTHNDPNDFVDAEKVALLKKIVDATDVKIVLSSNWKIGEGFEIIKHILLSHRIEIYDVTPTKLTSSRGQEIRMYLAENKKVKKFAILDDLSNAGNYNEHSFFQTDPFVGLTEEMVDKIIEHLK